MGKNSKFALLAGMLLIALIATACAPAAPAPAGDVTICVIGDMTGPLASYGADVLQGSEIAADEINAAGGINGKKISLKTLDEKNDSVEAVKIAQQAGDECVAAVIGSGSGPALAAGPYYEKAGLPFVITTSSNPKVTSSGWNYVARVQLSDYDQIKRLIDYAASTMGVTKLALLHDTSDLGTGGKDSLSEILKNVPKIKLVATEAWRQTDVDFSSQVLNAQRSGADAVYIIGAAEGAARILKQAQSLGFKVPFLSNTSVGNQKFLELAGDTAEGMTITWASVDPKNTRVQTIDKKMKEKYNRTVDIFVAQAYDGMDILAEAMKKVGTTKANREAIIKAVRSGTFSYALGQVTFDQSGHNIRHIYVARVTKGQFQIID